MYDYKVYDISLYSIFKNGYLHKNLNKKLNIKFT